MAQTTAHEVGHGFGLGEASGCPDNTSVMNAGTNGYNGTTGTYGPTTCDNGKVNEAGEYPTPTPTPTPTPESTPPPFCSEGAQAECEAQLGFWDNCRCNFWHPFDPLLIDVSGDGFDLTNASNGVAFDINGDGQREQVAWTVTLSDDAFLVLDRNGNGRVDSGLEVFGDLTPQPPSSTPNGFLALGEFDKSQNGGNADGLITSADTVFVLLRLWQDTNHNGVSESHELQRLPSLGVSVIELDYKESKKTDQFGNQFRYRAKVKNARGDQLGRWAWDVFLQRT